MKKILVILTGGTIGSKNDDTSINTDKASAYNLIKLYYSKYGTENLFEVIQPLNILSENMNLKNLSVFCKAISDIDLKMYKGIIITHGSDTLSYTSALIGMIYNFIDIPMVITASNYTLTDKRSNGLENFRSCITFINNSDIAGIFVIYQDSNKRNNIYISTRVQEADPYFDQFSAFGNGLYGYISENKITVNNSDFNNKIPKKISFESPVIFQNDILLIRPYPGMNYKNIDLSNKPAAVLHYLYHSATGSNENGKYSLTEFIDRCHMYGIDVYTASYKDITSTMYDTAKCIVDSGAVPMINISCEAAYMKLMLAYNQKQYQPSYIINQNIYYEHGSSLI